MTKHRFQKATSGAHFHLLPAGLTLDVLDHPEVNDFYVPFKK